MKRREEIVESAKRQESDRRHIAVPRQCTGQYPEMEYALAARIRQMRDLGVVVETWMVDLEAKSILHGLYPNEFPAPYFEVAEDDEIGFKCSNTWRQNFFNRHGFTQRKIGKKINRKGTLPERLEKAHEFHVRMRTRQLSEINDPVFGWTSPFYLMTHDQVPIELCDSNGSTIDDKGAIEIYDAVGKDSDAKRFCTLNLYGSMLLRDDLANLRRVHGVFSASKFQTADEWHDEEERQQ